ncbi:MAG TPA: hypothetical protein VIF62_31700 [Labilithrix sp.]|jgi:hypothetical protein
MRWILVGSMVLVAACHEKDVTPRAAVASESDEGEADDGEGDDALPASRSVTIGTQPARVRFLEEVRRVMGAAKTTHYSHVFEIDEPTGTFVFDCSGFVDYALSRSDPPALAALPRSPPKHLRPRAEDFVKAVSSGTAPWKSLGRASDLEPGDVVAWLRPADSKSKNTGHVMVVNGAPRAVGGSEWAVPVADSTALRHGASDSRAPAKATGLGQGTIVLVVDGAGAATAFRWSTSAKQTHATSIALGRIAL